MLKQILIPVAALAITVTGASAFTGGEMLDKLNINLTDSEQTALEEVKTIHEEAREQSDQVLKDAGITDERMTEIHQAMREAHNKEHEAVKAALEDNDYEAFKTAVADTPMAEEIDTAEKFAKMVEAHKLMEAGDKDGAKTIMDELGLKGPRGMGHGDGMVKGGPLGETSDNKTDE